MTSINFHFYRRAVFALAVSLILGTLGIGTGSNVVEAATHQSAVRTLRIVPTIAVQGGEAVVSVELDSLGDEVAMTFSVNFDPAKLNTPVITLGSGAPAGTATTINPNQAANGRIGFLFDSMNAFSMSGPARQVVSIKFNVAPGAPDGPTLVTFGNTPAPRSTSNFLGTLVPTSYADGSVTIGSASPQTVEVSGRVTTPAGNGLRNATVSLIDSNNNRRAVPTGSMGYYSFADVEPGTYTVSVQSRQYRFESRPVLVASTVPNVDFVGLD